MKLSDQIYQEPIVDRIRSRKLIISKGWKNGQEDILEINGRKKLEKSNNDKSEIKRSEELEKNRCLRI